VSRQMPVAQPDPELEAAANAFDAPASSSGQRRRVERTEVVSAPLGRETPWTSNPLVIIGGLLAAFIVGAGLVFLMVRTMMPTQPVVVEQPVAAPVAAQPAAAPVVTPIPQQAAPAPAAAAPVVTPIP